jgi:hypothetical protein
MNLQEFWIKYRHKTGFLAATIGLPLVLLLACTCCGGIGIGYSIRPDPPNNPWGIPPREAEKAAKFTKEQNDIKEKWLNVIERANDRNDRKAALKANQDMEAELEAHCKANGKPYDPPIKIGGR